MGVQRDPKKSRGRHRVNLECSNSSCTSATETEVLPRDSNRGACEATPAMTPADVASWCSPVRTAASKVVLRPPCSA
eukprot:3828811-Pyramimonas_sp.AAC.1